MTIDRRRFLHAAGAVGVGALAAPTSAGYLANETLRVGCVGTGGRCRALMKPLASIPGVKIAAVCDVYDAHLDLARKLADPKATATKRHQEVIEAKDLDAVLIATPDHWHAPLTVAACAAGKDVYVEKPLTHKRSEGRAVVEAQDRHKKIVQVGTQQRSMPQFQKGAELVRAGRLGRVFKARLTWNRNSDRLRKVPLNIDPKAVDWKAFLGAAPEQPFDEYRFRNWRWFWDFGNGILGDLMVHFIDVVHWYLGVDQPMRAAAFGTQIISKDVWETPDTVQVLLTYPGDVQAVFEGTFSNARSGACLEVMGTDATLYLDRGRYELVPERGKGEPEELVLGSGKKGADFYDKPDGELLHLTNWVECVRSRKAPNAPAEAGVGAAAAAHLGNEALRGGRVAEWRG